MRSEVESEIRRHVRTVMFRPQPERRHAERRLEKRWPYPHPVHVTPVEPNGQQLIGETVVVFGRHLSELGFDFYHHEPLTHRRVIVSFELSNVAWLGMLLDLSWCRFNRHGFYDSGGRFLGVVESPVPCMEGIRSQAAFVISAG